MGQSIVNLFVFVSHWIGLFGVGGGESKRFFGVSVCVCEHLTKKKRVKNGKKTKTKNTKNGSTKKEQKKKDKKKKKEYVYM